jgi:hypothetical protein
MLDECKVSFLKCPLWTDYLRYRVLQERPGTYPGLDIIRETAAKLVQEDERIGSLESSYDEYLRRLCELAVKSSDGDARNFFSMQVLRDSSAPPQQDLLAAAASLNKPLVVKRLLLECWSRGDRSRVFGNPWRQAAELGNQEVLDIYTEKDPWRFSSYCAWTTLCLASHGGHVEIVRQMLQPRWISPAITEIRVYSALLTSSVECFEIFMAWRENTPLRGPLTRESLSNLIDNAAKNGWTDMVRHLISLGAPINGRRDECDYRTCPIEYATENGHADVVQVLLDKGANVQRSDLLKAVAFGQPSVVRVFLKHGVRPKDAVALAARKGYFGIVQLLVSHGADVNEGDPAPIVGAAAAEHSDMVRYLIEHGATQNPPDAPDEVPEVAPPTRPRRLSKRRRLSQFFGRFQ